jgi:hypothetical protein
LTGLHSTDFLLYQRLYALYRQEAVRPGDLGGRTPTPPIVPGELLVGTESEAAEVRQHARAFLAQGQAREAEVLARRAYEMEANVEGAELLRQVEEALLRELRAELLEPPRVPSLAVPPSSLRAVALSPAEKYLLSRIDGQRDVEAIVRVSPVRELEALKAFLSFQERGLVRLSVRP